MTGEFLERLLRGRGSHVDPVDALAGLEWQDGGRSGPGDGFSIFRILNHAIYWQDLYLRRMEGAPAASPPRPSPGWPGPDAPPGPEAWAEAVNRFGEGVRRAVELAQEGDLERRLPTFGDHTLAEALLLLVAHNSYHVGQVVAVRRVEGLWPEPEDAW